MEIVAFSKDLTLKSHTDTPLGKSCRACRRRRVRGHPVKELAINKEHTIYVHFLSLALWKHITWRRDPWTLSCHSTLSMRQRSQIYRGGDAVPGLTTASRLTIIGLAAAENCCWLLKVSLSRRRRSAKASGQGGLGGRRKVL